MLHLQIIGHYYEAEGQGGGEEDEGGDEDMEPVDPDRLEEPDMEYDQGPPPDDEDDATIILGEDEEGSKVEGAGRGHVVPVGAMPAIPASVSSEVREAIHQAYLVSEGEATPARTITIAPLPGLQSPAPQAVPLIAGIRPHRVLTQRDKARVRAAVARVHPDAQRRSSRPRRPAPGSSGTPGTPALAQPPPPPVSQPAPQAPGPAIPLPSGGSWLPPALPAGCGVGTAPPGVTLLTQKKLSDTPKGQQGYKWGQRSRPYVPWAPTSDQLWEAYRLLRGEGEWATPAVRYLSGGSSRRSAEKPSLRWECVSCDQLVSSTADGRGHYQSSHLGGLHSSPLCSCPTARKGFNSCTVLAKHLDLQHNVDPTMVQHVPPFVYLKYSDRGVVAPTSGPPPKKSKH